MCSTNALWLLRSETGMHKLSFGCKILGDYMHTCLPVPVFPSIVLLSLDAVIGKINAIGVTEISGEAGSGKSQCCLVLSVQVIIAAAILL